MIRQVLRVKVKDHHCNKMRGRLFNQQNQDCIFPLSFLSMDDHQSFYAFQNSFLIFLSKMFRICQHLLNDYKLLKKRYRNTNIIKMNLQKAQNNVSKIHISTLLVCAIITFRISMIFIPLNYDYPDQYWQGPQIAYKIYNKVVNNKDLGYETWQWTIDDPIRNPVYQYLLASGYVIMNGVVKLIQILQQHNGLLEWVITEQNIDQLMEIGPKLIQSLLAIIGDIFMVKLLLFNFTRSSSQVVSTSSIIFLLSNWFYFTMLSRTYINSFQCILTTVAFYYWQLYYYNNSISSYTDHNYYVLSKNDLISRFVVLLAYVSRPTSLIPWMVIWPFEMIDCLVKEVRAKQSKKSIVSLMMKIIVKNILQILLMLMASFIIGTLYYSKPILTEWNFFYVRYLFIYFIGNSLKYSIQYNVVLKWSSFFETHSFHFYFTQSLPFMECGFALLLCVGLWKGLCHQSSQTSLLDKIKNSMFNRICWLMIALLVIQTLISEHKEHRFLLILSPFLMIVKLQGLQSVKQFFTKHRKYQPKIKIFFPIILASIILINLFMFWSVSLYPKGGFNILREIRNSINKDQQIEQNLHLPTKVGIMYLCESHALPAFSLILRDVFIQFPDESPLAKIKNQSEINLLNENPLEVYQKFKKNLNDSKQVNVRFIILQHKFTQIKFDKSLQNGEIISQKWKFIQKEYKLKRVQNNRNYWQELIFGPDYLYLFQKNQPKNKSQLRQQTKAGFEMIHS